MCPITDEGILEAAEGITDQTLYASLHTGAPPTAQNELNGGSYARVAVQPGAWHDVGAQRRNQFPITFPTPTADWVDPQYCALWTAATGGTPLVYGPISPDVAAPTQGNPVSIPVGSFVLGTGLGTEVTLAVDPNLVTLDQGGRVSAQLTAGGGSGAYVYSRLSGPAWINVNPATGAVTGIVPSNQDLALVSAVLQVRDSAGASATVTFSVDVKATGDPVTAICQPASLEVRRDTPAVRFTSQIVARGGAGGFQYAPLPSVPSWITVTSAGQITGLVGNDRNLGKLDMAFRVTDSEGATADAPFSLKVLEEPVSTLRLRTNPTYITVRQGGSFRGTLTASGGRPRHTFAVSAQPSGWRVGVSSLTGEFTYTVPSDETEGAKTVTFKVTDGAGDTATVDLTLNVQASIAPLTAAVDVPTQKANRGSTVTATLTGNGGTPVTARINGTLLTEGYTWTRVSGANWIDFEPPVGFGSPDGPVNALEQVRLRAVVPSSSSEAALGNHTATFRATDGSPTPQTADVTVTITIERDRIDIRIPTNVVTQPKRLDAISTATVTRGGNAPFTYTKQSGPDWLDVDRSTGVISGTVPSNVPVGTEVSITVRVQDADGTTADVEYDLTIISDAADTSSPSQDSTKDFNLHTTNQYPWCAEQVGGTVFVADSWDNPADPFTRKIFAYDINDAGVPVRNSAKDIDYSNLGGEDVHVRAMFTDGTTLWACLYVGDVIRGQLFKVFAFTLQSNSAPTRNAGRDFNPDAKHGPIRGGTAFGTVAWLSEGQGDCKAYDISGSGAPARLPNLDFDNDQESAGIRDMTNDGKTLYMADSNLDKGFAFVLGRNVKPVRKATKDFDFVSDNRNPQGICTDGTTIWVMDTRDVKGYGYAI